MKRKVKQKHSQIDWLNFHSPADFVRFNLSVEIICTRQTLIGLHFVSLKLRQSSSRNSLIKLQSWFYREMLTLYRKSLSFSTPLPHSLSLYLSAYTLKRLQSTCSLFVVFGFERETSPLAFIFTFLMNTHSVVELFFLSSIWLTSEFKQTKQKEFYLFSVAPNWNVVYDAISLDIFCQFVDHELKIYWVWIILIRCDDFGLSIAHTQQREKAIEIEYPFVWAQKIKHILFSVFHFTRIQISFLLGKPMCYAT